MQTAERCSSANPPATHSGECFEVAFAYLGAEDVRSNPSAEYLLHHFAAKKCRGFCWDALSKSVQKTINGA